MAFNDFTTALDMGQLTPAATLLRQLAYCESDEYRHQVIVTSHHEDLTNKLLDHFLPPPGHSMKVIEFTEWRADDGPDWKIYEARMPLVVWPDKSSASRRSRKQSLANGRNVVTVTGRIGRRSARHEAKADFTSVLFTRYSLPTYLDPAQQRVGIKTSDNSRHDGPRGQAPCGFVRYRIALPACGSPANDGSS